MWKNNEIQEVNKKKSRKVGNKNYTSSSEQSHLAEFRRKQDTSRNNVENPQNVYFGMWWWQQQLEKVRGSFLFRRLALPARFDDHRFFVSLFPFGCPGDIVHSVHRKRNDHCDRDKRGSSGCLYRHHYRRHSHYIRRRSRHIYGLAEPGGSRQSYHLQCRIR